MIEVKQFKLTTQEKNTISDVFDELSKISLTLLAEGVKTDEMPQMQMFDIIYYILENAEEGRGKEMRFSITNLVSNGNKIEVIENNLELETRQFFENLIVKQLDFFEKNIPQALNYFLQKTVSIDSH